jgi:Tfp pilus assembly major pilin PilA
MLRIAAIQIILAVICVIGVVLAPAALAEPEFAPSTKQTISGRGGSSLLSDSAGASIQCEQDTSTAEITGAKTVGGMVVLFTGCFGKTSESESACTVKSASAKNAGEIDTLTLKGLLGLVAKAEALSGVGLLLEPTTGHSWFTVAKATCATEAAVEGSVAGEITGVIEGGLAAEVNFVGSSGKQTIKKITVPAGEKEPELKAFGTAKASEDATDVLGVAKEIEIVGLKVVPRITVNPASKTFNQLTVALNQSENQTVTYTNNGPGAWGIGTEFVLLQERPGAQDGFSLLAANNTCFNRVIPETAPNNKCSVELQFKPPTVGLYNGAFKIVPLAPFMTLSGEGI